MKKFQIEQEENMNMNFNFDTILGNTCYERNFVANINEFSPEDQDKLLRGEEIYDTFHDDGAYCALSAE